MPSKASGAAVNRRRKAEPAAPPPSLPPCNSSSSSSSVCLQLPSLRSACRNPKIWSGLTQRDLGESVGLAFAVVIDKVFELKNFRVEEICKDHLAELCTTAVGESLSNFPGGKYNCFRRNFEKSFQKTLRTMRIDLYKSIEDRRRDQLCHHISCDPDGNSPESLGLRGSSNSAGINNSQPEELALPSNETHEQLSAHEEICESSVQIDSIKVELAPCQQRKQQTDHSCSSTVKSLDTEPIQGFGSCTGLNDPQLPLRSSASSSITCNPQPEKVSSVANESQEQLRTDEEKDETMRNDTTKLELAVRQQIDQQLAHVSSSTLGSVDSGNIPTMLSTLLITLQKSVTEQSRCNDLKEHENDLQEKKYQQKEVELALLSRSNYLSGANLHLGISKASFRGKKFKNQLEETRHAELLKKCIDCLVAGILIMSAALAYGAYTHSYKRIAEATESCKLPQGPSKPWWIPKPVSSFSSGLHVLRCQVQIVSRMLFGVLLILAVAYLLLQRSTSMNQTMPITFILLLLGVICGFAGKFCVETLGGDGYYWLFYWEALCLLHFFSNVCTSVMFIVLYGPVTASGGKASSFMVPYWFRRFLFYVTILLLLPLFCGLSPFAGPSEWKDHFYLLLADLLPPEQLN